MDSTEQFTPVGDALSPLRVIEPLILKELEHLDLSGRLVPEGWTLIGSGAYGDVWKGGLVVSGRGNANVAIKRLRFYLREDIKMLFEKEIYVWAKLKHANILPLLGYAFDVETRYPLLVSEWMGKGSAWSFVLSHPDCDIMRIVTGIAQGLAYLHEQGVVHSDIKSDNVLVTDSEDAVIGDFGCARMIASSRTLANLTTGIKGTARYLAHELLASSDQCSGHSKETDVWAFGMTVFELLARQRPYSKLSEFQIIAQLMKMELPSFPKDTVSRVSNETKQRLWKICQHCWKREPMQRADMSFIVARLLETCPQKTDTLLNSTEAFSAEDSRGNVKRNREGDQELDLSVSTLYEPVQNSDKDSDNYRKRRRLSDASGSQEEDGQQGAQQQLDSVSTMSVATITDSAVGVEDGRVYTCSMCPKTYKSVPRLRDHLNTHTGAEPYECPHAGCTRRFAHMVTYNRHAWLEHSNTKSRRQNSNQAQSTQASSSAS